MKDRVVQYPNRYKLSLVSGTTDTFDLEAVPGTVTELGSDLNKANILPDSLAVKLGLNPNNNPQIKDVFLTISSLHPEWQLVQSYTAAGAYNWLVPDIYGNGKDYRVGVFEIGGGQSGKAVLKTNNTSYGEGACATGGISGEAKSFERVVTPGETISIVIGAGGVSSTINASFYDRADHIASQGGGGSTSFDGVIALGGGSGYYGLSVGQFPDTLAGSYYSGNGGNYICGLSSAKTGEPQRAFTSYSNPYFFGSAIANPLSRYTDFINRFDETMALGAAGGSCQAFRWPEASNLVATFIQNGATIGTGYAGNGVAYAYSGFASVVIGGTATSPGSGGGGCAVSTDTVTAGNYSITGGAGAPGAVYTYIRKGL